MIEEIRERLSELFLATSPGYSAYTRRHGWPPGPRLYPPYHGENVVLKTNAEWERACREAEALHLPLHPIPEKNWDSLIALRSILTRTDKSAKILDAGATIRSVILPWLSIYGYRNLIGINLSIDKPIRRGPIRFKNGDLTKTAFEDNTFDAITCLSVIEHGIDLEEYFAEMSRILKPGGVLITSTDYWETPIDTTHARLFDLEWQVFSRETIGEVLSTAKHHGFALSSRLDLDTEETTLCWAKMDCEYTFAALTMLTP